MLNWYNTYNPTKTATEMKEVISEESLAAPIPAAICRLLSKQISGIESPEANEEVKNEYKKFQSFLSKQAAAAATVDKSINVHQQFEARYAAFVRFAEEAKLASLDKRVTFSTCGDAFATRINAAALYKKDTKLTHQTFKEVNDTLCRELKPQDPQHFFRFVESNCQTIRNKVYWFKLADLSDNYQVFLQVQEECPHFSFERSCQEYKRFCIFKDDYIKVDPSALEHTTLWYYYSEFSKFLNDSLHITVDEMTFTNCLRLYLAVKSQFKAEYSTQNIFDLIKHAYLIDKDFGTHLNKVIPLRKRYDAHEAIKKEILQEPDAETKMVDKIIDETLRVFTGDHVTHRSILETYQELANFAKNYYGFTKVDLIRFLCTNKDAIYKDHQDVMAFGARLRQEDRVNVVEVEGKGLCDVYKIVKEGFRKRSINPDDITPVKLATYYLACRTEIIPIAGRVEAQLPAIKVFQYYHRCKEFIDEFSECKGLQASDGILTELRTYNNYRKKYKDLMPGETLLVPAAEAKGAHALADFYRTSVKPFIEEVFSLPRRQNNTLYNNVAHLCEIMRNCFDISQPTFEDLKSKKSFLRYVCEYHDSFLFDTAGLKAQANFIKIKHDATDLILAECKEAIEANVVAFVELATQTTTEKTSQVLKTEYRDFYEFSIRFSPELKKKPMLFYTYTNSELKPLYQEYCQAREFAAISQAELITQPVIFANEGGDQLVSEYNVFCHAIGSKYCDFSQGKRTELFRKIGCRKLYDECKAKELELVKVKYAATKFIQDEYKGAREENIVTFIQLATQITTEKTSQVLKTEYQDFYEFSIRFSPELKKQPALFYTYTDSKLEPLYREYCQAREFAAISQPLITQPVVFANEEGNQLVAKYHIFCDAIDRKYGDSSQDKRTELFRTIGCGKLYDDYIAKKFEPAVEEDKIDNGIVIKGTIIPGEADEDEPVSDGEAKTGGPENGIPLPIQGPDGATRVNIVSSSAAAEVLEEKKRAANRAMLETQYTAWLEQSDFKDNLAKRPITDNPEVWEEHKRVVTSENEAARLAARERDFDEWLKINDYKDAPTSRPATHDPKEWEKYKEQVQIQNEMHAWLRKHNFKEKDVSLRPSTLDKRAWEVYKAQIAFQNKMTASVASFKVWLKKKEYKEKDANERPSIPDDTAWDAYREKIELQNELERKNDSFEIWLYRHEYKEEDASKRPQEAGHTAWVEYKNQIEKNNAIVMRPSPVVGKFESSKSIVNNAVIPSSAATDTALNKPINSASTPWWRMAGRTIVRGLTHPLFLSLLLIITVPLAIFKLWIPLAIVGTVFVITVAHTLIKKALNNSHIAKNTIDQLPTVATMPVESKLMPANSSQENPTVEASQARNMSQSNLLKKQGYFKEMRKPNRSIVVSANHTNPRAPISYSISKEA